MDDRAMPLAHSQSADRHPSLDWSRNDLVDEEAETEAGLAPVAGFHRNAYARADTAELAPSDTARRLSTRSARHARSARSPSNGQRRVRRRPAGLTASLVTAVIIGTLVGATLFVIWQLRPQNAQFATAMATGSAASATHTVKPTSGSRLKAWRQD